MLEYVYRLGGEESAGSLLGAEVVHLGVALHIVYKTLAYVFALCDDLDVFGGVPAYLVVEDGVVGAAQDDGVYLVVLGQ